MFEQRTEEGQEQVIVREVSDEGRDGEAPRHRDGFRCYSLEVLLQLED